VIYTSGSTGKPKGVQVEHRNVVNFLAGIRAPVPMGPGDTLVAVTPLSFDISALELYLPLLEGATVAIVDREEAQNGEALMHRLHAIGATAMQATPTTWRILLEAGWEPPEAFSILCGGEKLPHELAVALAGKGSVWDLYGPTETTIWSSTSRVDASGGRVAFTPVANTQIHVVDRDLELLPHGAPGEVVIGGAGLARGYANDPRQTAERFVPDPYSPLPGGRLYHTGDVGHRLEDGTVELGGRIDEQIKLRGFRIEPGEIEAALEELPDVLQAVVVAKTGPAPGDERLVAYVVPGMPSPSSARLRDTLRSRLPAHMIPAAFELVDTLPRTDNGKVARGVLARLPLRREDEPVDGRPPANGAERTVARVWEEVLGVGYVPVDGNFFDLGGHSLAVIRLASRFSSTFAVDVPVAAIFEHPTVADLARLLDADQAVR
jgi:acyl-coenzyme A synthetase/AMP-(fatty) acid ligase/acyl carrier protein